MRRSYDNLFDQAIYGRKRYFADSLTDYMRNFESVSHGRNGIITKIYGIYKIFY